MTWKPRCKRCHRVLTDPDNIKRGYGPICYLKTFGHRPRKPNLKIYKCKGYIRTDEIPPLFVFDPEIIEREEANCMGTITVINHSTLTDRAALALTADYYNDRKNMQLIDTMISLNIKIIKKGHKFIVVDIN